MAEPVDLQEMVEQWTKEFALESQLADLHPGTDNWVPLAEAERQAGVSRSTLRAWYRGGQIASRLMPGPHGLQRLVPLAAVLDRAKRSPRTGPRPAPAKEEPVSPGLSPTDAMVRMAELAAHTAADRAEAAEARAVAAETGLHAALERAAAAEAELRLLREGR